MQNRPRHAPESEPVREGESSRLPLVSIREEVAEVDLPTSIAGLDGRTALAKVMRDALSSGQALIGASLMESISAFEFREFLPEGLAIPSRVSQNEMDRRLLSAIDWSRRAFAASAEILGIGVYGSVIRGRSDARDVDIRVLTTYCAPDTADLTIAVENTLQERVRRELERQKVSDSCHHLPANIFIDTAADEMWYSVDVLRHGPYVVFLRPKVEGGPLPCFGEIHGTTYLRNRSTRV